MEKDSEKIKYTVGKYYRLRNGITVLLMAYRKLGNMLVLVTESKDMYWKVGEERLLTSGGSGHMWGREYDIIKERGHYKS